PTVAENRVRAPSEELRMALALQIPRIASVCTDAELIQRTGAGDHLAFDKLYRRYSRPVFGLALRRLGDRGRAEDAVQETFVSIWRAARSCGPARGPAAPWLSAAARNAITARARARSEPPMEAPDTPSSD